MSPHMSRPSRRPRIGVDFHTFDGIFQGSRSHLLGLYGQAVQLAPHWDFFLLLDDPQALCRDHPVFDRPNVHPTRMPQAAGPVRLAWQLPLLRRELQLDLLHLQYRLPWWGEGPYACTIHDVLFESHPQFFSRPFTWLARWSSRDAVRRARALLTVSAYSQAEMARHYGVAPSRIQVTHNGVDLARFRPDIDPTPLQALGLTPGGYLCCVGRLEPRKNHAGLVQAYARLPAGQRPPLVIVGQRDFAYAEVFKLVQQLGLQDEVRFLERVSDAELGAVLAHARLFVYPSWAEGFGMPVLEAMACGVPVVTSRGTALQEVAEGVAWLADPHDPAQLAQVMARALAEDDAARQARIAQGLARARAFDWASSARVLLQSLAAALPGAMVTPDARAAAASPGRPAG